LLACHVEVRSAINPAGSNVAAWETRCLAHREAVVPWRDGDEETDIPLPRGGSKHEEERERLSAGPSRNRRILQRNLTMLCGAETANSGADENELQNLGQLMRPIVESGQLTLPKGICLDLATPGYMRTTRGSGGGLVFVKSIQSRVATKLAFAQPGENDRGDDEDVDERRKHAADGGGGERCS